MDDNFRAIFSLVDQVSAPILVMAGRVEAANKSIEASAARMFAAFAPLQNIQGAFGALHTQMSRLGTNVGFDRISRAAGTLGGRLGSLTQQIAGMLGPVAALGGLASLGGLAAAMHNAVETGSALNDLWTKLGAATASQRGVLADMRYSASQTGADSELVTTGITKLNRALAEAAGGANQDVANLFRRLGISMRDSNGQVRNGIDLMPQLAAAMQRNENAAVRTRIAMALFGRTGAELIPALLEFEENATRRRTFGSTFTPEQVSALDAFGDAWADLKMAVNSVSNAIGAQLAPVLTPLIEDLAHWIAANRALVVTEVKTFIKGIADSLKVIDWTAAWQGVRDFGRAVNDVVQYFGGWQVAVGAMAAVMAGPLLLAIVGIGTALGALGVAVLSTPIGLFATTLAAAGYAIYANWDKITGAFDAATEAVSSFFARFMERARPTLDVIGSIASALGAGLLAPIRSAWDGIASLIEGAAARIMRVLQPVLNVIGSITGGGRTTAAPESTRPAGTRRRGTINGAQAIEDLPEPANDAGARAETLRQAGTQGVVRVQVDFANMPPGATATADATGAAVAPPQLAVGYAMGGAR